ncbi:FAD-dependent oxidoreductase [Chloroflexota bacterium]
MNGKMSFPKLFEPGWIGEMEVKNRTVMAPMGSRTIGTDGYVTQRMLDYYEARARGGVGLIVVEVACVDSPMGKSGSTHLVVDDDKYIPGLSNLVEIIHKHGARAALQLQHGGRGCNSATTGLQPVAPSAIPIPDRGWQGAGEGEMPRELAISEIKDIIAKFGRSAGRAKKAGFDGVEIHGLGLYLVAQFLSSASNKRQDEYGGDLQNRARFLVEIIQAAKESAGRNFPVWCRLSIKEIGLEGGITIEEGQQFARIAQRAGADAIHAHTMTWGVSLDVPPPMSMSEPPGSMMTSIEAIKKAVTIPVIAIGRIYPELGERILQEKRADFIAMGKGLLADPDISVKAESGRVDEIVPCIGCTRCLFGSELECSVNAALSKEREYEFKPAEKSKKVLVVGGGPAGMEAARVAALRGHRVTLYEKQPRLGGQLLWAIVPPHKENLPALIDYLATQMQKRDVDVRLGVEATPELIEKEQPDVVILAAGATPFIPEILGIDGTHMVTALEVLDGKEVGQKVVIIGGELVACETAEYLVERGKKVTITEVQPAMATQIFPQGLRPYRLSKLAASGVDMFEGVTYQQITDKSVDIVTREGVKQAIEADTVVIAAGTKPDKGLLQSLEGRVPEIYTAGDCVEPQGIKEAVAGGFDIGRKI